MTPMSSISFIKLKYKINAPRVCQVHEVMLGSQETMGFKADQAIQGCQENGEKMENQGLPDDQVKFATLTSTFSHIYIHICVDNTVSNKQDLFFQIIFQDMMVFREKRGLQELTV